MKEYRMRLARVGTPDNDEVRLLDLPVGTCSSSQTKDRRQTDDAGGVSRAVAAINVVGSYHRPCKLLGKEVKFVRGLRTTENSKGLSAILGNGFSEARRYTV